MTTKALIEFEFKFDNGHTVKKRWSHPRTAAHDEIEFYKTRNGKRFFHGTYKRYVTQLSAEVIFP